MCLTEFGAVDGDLGDGAVAGVGGGEVLLLGVVEGLLGDYAVLRHLEVAVVGVLVHGEVGGFCADLVVFDGGFCSLGVGFGGEELGLLGIDLGEDLDLVQLGEDLALFDGLVDVGLEVGDDAGGLGFDLYLGDGLDFAGGDDGAGDVAAFGLAELGGLKLGAVALGGDCPAESYDDYEGDEASPDPDFAFAFTICRHGGAP